MQAPIGPSYFLQWLYILVLLTKNVCAGLRYSSRIVETKSGAIRGVILELNSRHLEPVEAFRAVPYAAPPVDGDRFERPKTLLPWKGTKLADTFGPVCPQVCIFYEFVFYILIQSTYKFWKQIFNINLSKNLSPC